MTTKESDDDSQFNTQKPGVFMSMGANSQGQLGDATGKNQWVPQLLNKEGPALTPVSDLVATPEHRQALTIHTASCGASKRTETLTTPPSSCLAATSRLSAPVDRTARLSCRGKAAVGRKPSRGVFWFSPLLLLCVGWPKSTRGLWTWGLGERGTLSVYPDMQRSKRADVLSMHVVAHAGQLGHPKPAPPPGQSKFFRSQFRVLRPRFVKVRFALDESIRKLES